MAHIVAHNRTCFLQAAATDRKRSATMRLLPLSPVIFPTPLPPSPSPPPLKSPTSSKVEYIDNSGGGECGGVDRAVGEEEDAAVKWERGRMDKEMGNRKGQQLVGGKVPPW